MAAHNLLSKCDRALAAYLIAEGAGTSADVYPAKRSLDKVLPDTLCHCDSASELAPYSGTYLVRASINVRSQAAILADDDADDPDQPREDADTRVAATFDAFHKFAENSSGDQLGAAITAAAAAAGVTGLTIQDVEVKGLAAGFEEKGSTWIDTLTLELIACPNDGV